jgi:hypothetical protein
VSHSDESTRLLDALRLAGEALNQRGLPWALVGGLAVSTRAEPRFTRDVDLAVGVAGDAVAESLVADLQGQGYQLQTVLEQQALGRLATVRLTPPAFAATGVVVDLLFASSGIEADVCEAAERLEVVPGLTVPVARVGHLIAMKLLSRAAHRLQDDIDLRNLRVALTPEDVQLAREGVARIEAVGANRGRALRADLERYLAEGTSRS